jgi:hypothetical protein
VVEDLAGGGPHDGQRAFGLVFGGEFGEEVFDVSGGQLPQRQAAACVCEPLGVEAGDVAGVAGQPRRQPALQVVGDGIGDGDPVVVGPVPGVETVGECAEPRQRDGLGAAGDLDPAAYAGSVAAEVERADPGLVCGVVVHRAVAAGSPFGHPHTSPVRTRCQLLEPKLEPTLARFGRRGYTSVDNEPSAKTLA